MGTAVRRSQTRQVTEANRTADRDRRLPLARHPHAQDPRPDPASHRRREEHALAVDAGGDLLLVGLHDDVVGGHLRDGTRPRALEQTYRLARARDARRDDAEDTVVEVRPAAGAAQVAGAVLVVADEQ